MICFVNGLAIVIFRNSDGSLQPLPQLLPTLSEVGLAMMWSPPPSWGESEKRSQEA